MAWFGASIGNGCPSMTNQKKKKATSSTTDVKLLVLQPGGNSLCNKEGMGDEALEYDVTFCALPKAN